MSKLICEMRGHRGTIATASSPMDHYMILHGDDYTRPAALSFYIKGRTSSAGWKPGNRMSLISLWYRKIFSWLLMCFLNVNFKKELRSLTLFFLAKRHCSRKILLTSISVLLFSFFTEKKKHKLLKEASLKKLPPIQVFNKSHCRRVRWKPQNFDYV